MPVKGGAIYYAAASNRLPAPNRLPAVAATCHRVVTKPGKAELLSAPMPCFRVLERIRRHEQQRLQDFVVGGMRAQQLLHQVEQNARSVELVSGGRDP